MNNFYFNELQFSESFDLSATSYRCRFRTITVP